MMIIHVSDDYRIISDKRQWILQKLRWVNASTRKWDALGHYVHLNNAVLALARLRIRCLKGEHGPETLEPLCRALDSIHDAAKDNLKACPHCGKAL